MSLQRPDRASCEMQRVRGQAPHRLELGLVDVRRFRVDHERADRRSDRPGHLLLKPRELDEVAVRLLAEVERERVDGELQLAAGAPEVQQRHARHVGRVGERLERRDRSRPRLRIGPQPLHHPGDLVTPVVVTQPTGVGARAAELRHVVGLGEVPAHPIEPVGVGEGGDQVVARIRSCDPQRDERQLSRREAVVGRLGAGFDDPARNLEPGLAPRPCLDELHSGAILEARYGDPLSSVAEPLHRTLGLTDREFDRIGELLGRSPNDFELAVFSVLWSEHCGYKHSARLLKRLPSSGERVLQGPGENAGVIDLGDGLAVAFKVESHNHPSAVEPFQGAATGVGGIIRDVVAMGARPIALLDGLRFGSPDWHFRRAVAGIAHYGNSAGIANVGGETVFDDAYAANPLVNAMCVGLLPTERVLRARASGPGTLVVLYGAYTGRDGIGGASVLASQDLAGSDEKRPSVQIGDPFRGKALVEVSLELVDRDTVLSLQDCGAGGLASSLAEMAREVGVDVHLDRVPPREADLEPWEIMISESQERMVAVVAPERLDDVRAVCERWDLPCTVIGEVTDHGELRCFFDDETVGSIPATLLTDECPRYEVATAPHSVEA